MNNRTRKGLLIFLLVILLTPLIQKNLQLVDSGQLHGYFTNAPSIDFSWEKWWDGSYQKGEESYLNDHVGFRQDLIRLNNQIDYDLFRKMHFYAGMLGRNHCLWDRTYVEAYQGKDFSGYDTLCKTLYKLKKVQDTLAHLGKTLILIHPASKGFFYTEDFPADMRDEPIGATNYQTCVRIGDSLGINQVDFNGWFRKIKKDTGDQLYTKQGIHWAVYGASVAADSMVKYMEHLTGEKMPELTWSYVEHTTEARFTDDDLSKPLNLMIPYHEETYSYPQIAYIDQEKRKRPKAIYIGDSFMFQWIYLGVPDHIHEDWQFWYYFNEVCNRQYHHGDYYQPHIKENNWGWVDELNKTDMVVLIYNATSLNRLGSGFIEKAYDHYYPGAAQVNDRF